MDHEYHSPFRQLKKAKRKLSDLERELDAYYRSEYRTKVEELDLKTGCMLHKLRIVKFPGDEVTDLVYEIIDCHRSALDQTAHIAAMLSGITGKALERTQFPVTAVASEFENVIKRACAGFHPELESLFRSFAAHPGGNDLLVELNGIRRQGYHRIIVPVGVAAENVSVGVGRLSGRPAYIPAPIWDRKKHEITYRSVGDGGEFGYDASITLNVCFGEVESVAGKPVVAWLFATNAEVFKVVEQTVLCTNRLGLTDIR